MRTQTIVVATMAWVAGSLAGCLDTKADMPAANSDAGGGVWSGGAGSVKPALAQPTAGGGWSAEAGSGASRAQQQPAAAAGAAAAQAGGAASAPSRRVIPAAREAVAMDGGLPDSGAPDSGSADAGSFDAGAESEDWPEQSSSQDGETSAEPAPEQPGDLVITELMIDPKALPDAEGEWIELYNATDLTLELRDCQLDDGAKSLHDIPVVLVEPFAYFTIAREPEPGFVADLVVPLALTNSADSIAIVCGGQEIDRVSYDKAEDFAIRSGASLALDPEQLDAHANDMASAWCEGTAEFAGDLGSPGFPNASCAAGTENVEGGEQGSEEPSAEEPHDEDGCEPD